MNKALGTGVFLLFLMGCDSFQPTNSSDSNAVCQQGDSQVPSSSLCLMDDAACYQLNNGQWCTGPRPGNGSGGWASPL